MKRLIALVVVLALLVFYVAWPGWTAYQVATAIKAKDSETLQRKISFNDVRESLKPAAILKIGEVYNSFKAQAGPAGAAIVAQIKADVVPKIAEGALNNLVTAPNLIRVVHDGRSLKENAERILQEQVGKIGLPGLPGTAARPGGGQLPGGLGQLAGKIGLDLKQIPGIGAGEPKAEGPPPSPSAPTAAAPPPQFGIANIKAFRLLGPLAFELGVAKDATAANADVHVELRFVDADWRIVGIRPRM